MSRSGDSRSPGEPVTPAQRRLLVAQRLAPNAAHANVVRVLRLRGVVDVGRLVGALAALVRRHASLRTTFPAGGDRQVVRGDAAFALAQEHVRAAPEGARVDIAAQIGSEESLRPFDLACAPLLRARLVCFDDNDHILCIAVHNIACDGWSLGLLARELADGYTSPTSGADSPPDAPAIPTPEGAKRAETIAWWRSTLDGAPGAFEWPAARAPRSFEARRLVARPGEALTAAVATLARAAAVTPYVVHLAAFLVSLRALGAGDDLVIGSPVSRRTAASRTRVGLYTDMIAIRVDLGGNPEFEVLLGRTRAAATAAFLRQDVAYQDLVDVLPARAAPQEWPLFDAVLNVTGDRQRIPATWSGLNVAPIAIPRCHALPALSLFVRDDRPCVLEAVHRLDALAAGDGAAFLAGHLRLLAKATSDPARRIDALAD